MKKLLGIFALCVSMLLPILSFSASMSGPFPRGNYYQSCHNCSFNGRWLSCFCKDRNGFVNESSLRVPHRCNFVENLDGNLTCTHWQHRRHFPHRIKLNFNAGPIFTQLEARHRCPRVCGNHWGSWTGNWNTVVPGQMSVCQCIVRR